MPRGGLGWARGMLCWDEGWARLVWELLSFLLIYQLSHMNSFFSPMGPGCNSTADAECVP